MSKSQVVCFVKLLLFFFAVVAVFVFFCYYFLDHVFGVNCGSYNLWAALELF